MCRETQCGSVGGRRSGFDVVKFYPLGMTWPSVSQKLEQLYQLNRTLRRAGLLIFLHRNWKVLSPSSEIPATAPSSHLLATQDLEGLGYMGDGKPTRR